MINVLFDDHRQILEVFHKYEVRYLLIGGYAVNYYGYIRTTGDMDLWIEPTNENKIVVIKALQDYGIEEEQLELLAKEDFSQHIVFSIGSPPVKVDFITRVSQVDFAQAYVRKNLMELDGVTIPIVRYEDLILMKFNTGRIKDQHDMDMLQKINKG